VTARPYPERARDMVREVAPGFAWPGGYPLALLMADGFALCPACAVANVEAIADADPRDSWRAEGAFIHWEGPALVCAHCNARVESAYGGEE
jgi:hypothetical protein